MKTFYSIMLVLVMSINALAQNKVNIVIFSDDADPFYVVINGVRQNMKAETNVRISDLNMESFSFVIIFNDPKIKSITRKQYLLFGSEYTFRIKKDKKGNRLLKPFGQVELNQAPTNNGASNVVYHTEEYPATTTNNNNGNTNTVNTNGSVDMSSNNGSYQENTSTSTTVNSGTNTAINTNVNANGTNMSTGVNTTTGNTGSENVAINVNMNGMGFNMNVNVSGTGTENSSGVNTNMDITGFEGGNNNTVTTNVNGTNTSSSTSGNSGNINSGFSGNNNNTGNQNTSLHNTGVSNSASGCYAALSNSEFQEMKKSVSSKSFSETRMRTAKQITQNNCLSAIQVKEMMETFDFEGDRLEYAKYAYDYTIDKKNFYMVNDAFTFESSISELDEYINKKK